MPYADVCWKLDRELALSANCGHSALTAGCRKAAVRDRASRYGHSSTGWISGIQLARAHPWFPARHCVNCTHR